MKMLQGFLPMLSLLALVLTSVLVHAQNDQSGFISIDCGIEEGYTYTDDVTNINYVSDANFTDSGEIHKIQPEYILSTNDTQLTTLTSFPKNTRNCYTLQPTQGKGNKYLLRARFMYGNYDFKEQLPEFDVYLGPDYWDTVKIKSSSNPLNMEIIHVMSSDYIHVCLMNTGRGTPFVSAIELRLLAGNMYQETSFGSFSLYARADFGTSSGTVRYEADKYDRIWSPLNLPNSTVLYTSDQVNTNNAFQPPSEVMSSAITPIYSNASIEIHWDSLNTNDQFFVYAYFSEIERLKGNQKREFNIYLNGNIFYGLFSPASHSTSTLYWMSPAPVATQYTLVLNKTQNSTLPPLINALELYTLKLLPQRQTYDHDVAAMWKIKSTYSLTKNWQGDPCAPREYVWDGIRCIYNDTEFPRIVSLNFSASGLKGEIDAGLGNLTMMQTLDLSNNNLTGTVPDFLSGLTFLMDLNLKGNNFIGPIPSGLLAKANKGSLLLSFDGESTGDPTRSSSCDRNTCKNKMNNKLIVPLIAVASTFVILIALVFVWKIRNAKGRGRGLEIRKKKYTYSEIQNITNNFSVVLGKGAFGTVYHGTIGETQVAIKVLSGSSLQGDKEFQAEAYLLLSVHHKNLTSLVGYCNDDNHKGIVYEYMANGNLESHLLDTSSSVLNWEERLQIGCDAAHGLEYLHHGCKPPIVHRDVKCNNILLNEAFQAKLADFGLSRAFPIEGGSHISTVVAGTPGYLDPEYYTSNKLIEKSDVYSFGVVLLVRITGQPAITKYHNDNIHISGLVKLKLAEGDINSIVDPVLQGDFDVNLAWKAVELAMACVVDTPSKRPTMKEVVVELNYCLMTERERQKAKPKDLTGLTSLNMEIAHDPTPV